MSEDQSDMRYREIQPGPYLARFVECFWTLEKAPDDGTIPPQRILPDGCVELILNFGDKFLEHKANGHTTHQPINFLVGQMTRPTLISPTGVVDLIGIRFQPAGTLPFFRVPMHQVTDQIVDLGALSDSLERDLMSRVYQAQFLSERIAALERLLLERTRDCKHDSWLVELAGKLIQVGGVISIDSLAEDAGLSNRQLERRFLMEVGVGPKLLCRILRFQQVFRAFDRNDSRWSAVAADCGYYDQAHLIRDFRQFAGQAPSRLFADFNSVTEAFTRKNRMSNFSKTRSFSVP